MADWRVGKSYGVHVYEGDRPVATFFTQEDAQAAVAARNALTPRRECGAVDPRDSSWTCQRNPHHIGQHGRAGIFWNPGSQDRPTTEKCPWRFTPESGPGWRCQLDAGHQSAAHIDRSASWTSTSVGAWVGGLADD